MLIGVSDLIRELIFWGIWLVIPLIVDVFSGISGALMVFKQYFKKKSPALEFMPYVNILVPVYNSARTLKSCLASIKLQNYPTKHLTVFLIDNGTRDESYEIFCEFQRENPTLKIWWLDSSKGKAKALNKGLYMSEGKYIINIDSDGVLDKNAILRVVEKFEGNTEIYAMTGVVLIDKEFIEKTKGYFMKLVQRCEFFEYTEAFLVGRGFQSASNTMFTLAGAFSCYRKDIVLKTQLYNNETLGEDTHMTSQIRNLSKGEIALCENAFFYVDPVESLDKLYIQRQRWQRGQLEVASLFRKDSRGSSDSIGPRKNRWFKVLNLNLLKDHTLVFPRFIWLFAMLYLVFLDYPLSLVVGANILMYLVYVFSSLLYYLVARLYLIKNENKSRPMSGATGFMTSEEYSKKTEAMNEKAAPPARRQQSRPQNWGPQGFMTLEEYPEKTKTKNKDSQYMDKHFYIIFLLPLYRLLVFLMRLAGIINSTARYASWNTKTFSEEKLMVRDKLAKNFKIYFMVKEWVNNG